MLGFMWVVYGTKPAFNLTLLLAKNVSLWSQTVVLLFLLPIFLGLLALALGCKSVSLVNTWGNYISEPALVGQDFSWGDQRKYPSHLERTVSWSELCPGSLAGFCFFQAVGLASGSLQPGSSESLFCTLSCLKDSAAWLVYSWRKGPRESGQLQELLKCF